MTRKLTALLLFLGLVFSMAGCGTTDSPSNSGTSDSQPTELIFNHIFATGSIEDQCANMFADLVEEYTDGAYTVTVYPAGQMGAMAEIIEQQQTGTAHFQIISTTAMASIAGVAAIDSWPYMFSNREEFERAYASEAGKAWLAQVEEETGFTLVTTMYKGLREIFLNKEAETLDDLSGVKLRVASFQEQIDQFRAFGLAPTPMSTSEVYTAMSQNVVEGMEIELSTAADMALQEVTETVMMTDHAAANYAILCYTEYFDSLPTEIQDAFVQAGNEAGVWLADQIESADEAALQVFIDAGCKIVYPDTAAWQEIAYSEYADMYPEYAAIAEQLRAAAKGE